MLINRVALDPPSALVCRLGDPRALDLARLKHDVPIGEDDRRRPLAEALENIEGLRVEAVGERIIHQVRGHR